MYTHLFGTALLTYSEDLYIYNLMFIDRSLLFHFMYATLIQKINVNMFYNYKKKCDTFFINKKLVVECQISKMVDI